MDFSGFVGQPRAKLALILNAIDPRCGGVLFVGERGMGKSTLARLFRRLLSRETPFVELPLNATEEAVLGGIDMEEAIRTGRRRYQPGVLARAQGGFVYIDDVNLLANELLAQLILEQGKGAAGFQVLASMNAADTPLSSHLLDRFGMAAGFEKIVEPEVRMAIVRAAISGPSISGPEDLGLRDAIGQARRLLPSVTVPETVERYITERCAESLAAGHRGDVFLRTAARAFAAFQKRREVEQTDVDALLPLVLDHRRRSLPPQEPDQPQAQQQQESQSEQDETPPQNDTESAAPQSSQPESGAESSPEQRESQPREQVFDVGESFAVRRFHFDRDRLKRGSSGRKLKSLSRDKRGRYVKSVNRGDVRDIAIDATIRAAAPWQRARGAGETLDIRTDDFRFKQREKKVSHLAVFVVDGSGSMGAQRRMIATKGAIQSLLVDSYQKRDKVAMIVFRKDHAELVLPPTSSVQLASRLLHAIPVGGKTPLSSGLWLAHELVRRTTLREAETRFLVTLITDGRANHSMTDASPAEEAARTAAMLRELRFTEFLVIDTESQSALVQTGRARQISDQLGADYFAIEELKSESLATLVQSHQGAFK